MHHFSLSPPRRTDTLPPCSDPELPNLSTATYCEICSHQFCSEPVTKAGRSRTYSTSHAWKPRWVTRTFSTKGGGKVGAHSIPPSRCILQLNQSSIPVSTQRCLREIDAANNYRVCYLPFCRNLLRLTNCTCDSSLPPLFCGGIIVCLANSGKRIPVRPTSPSLRLQLQWQSSLCPAMSDFHAAIS